MATTKLVKELGEGVEFHLSLNPPTYAMETMGILTIDYKKIRESNIISLEKNEEIKTKELPQDNPSSDTTIEKHS